MSQSLHLFSLQKIDTQIDRIVLRLNEIEKILRTDKKVIEAQKCLDTVSEKYENAKRVLRLVEDEVQTNKIKQETSEAALYGGRIHNPKELQDIQKEIETRKKLLSNLEEKQLEAMINLEEIEAEKKACEGSLNEAQASAIQQKASLAGERDLLLKNKNNLENEKSAISTSISGDNIEIYNRLRQQKKGLAVSAIEDAACACCGSDLRPEEMQLAYSKNNLYYCNSCGRILFVG
jgi:uncharacterized protein